MKISFSTIGCPDWMLNEVLAAAVDFGYDGVEIRGLGEDLFLPKAPCFGEKRLKTSLKEIADSGLEISCISADASCLLNSSGADVVDRIKQYCDLTALIGAKNIRLLADEWGQPSPGLNREQVCRNLAAVAPYAEQKGVKLLVETCGVYADTAVTRELILRVNSPAVGVLWDIHHPYRYFAESPAQTLKNIGEWVAHVHVKDGVMVNYRPEYKMLGHGDLPLAGMFAELKKIGYTGHLSLEWMKRWNDELEAPGIVFSHYARKIKRYL